MKKFTFIMPEEGIEFRIIKRRSIFIPQVKTTSFFKRWISLDRWFGNLGIGPLPGYNDYRIIMNPYQDKGYSFDDAKELIEEAMYQIKMGEDIKSMGQWPVQTAVFDSKLDGFDFNKKIKL